MTTETGLSCHVFMWMLFFVGLVPLSHHTHTHTPASLSAGNNNGASAHQSYIGSEITLSADSPLFPLRTPAIYNSVSFTNDERAKMAVHPETSNSFFRHTCQYAGAVSLQSAEERFQIFTNVPLILFTRPNYMLLCNKKNLSGWIFSSSSQPNSNFKKLQFHDWPPA